MKKGFILIVLSAISYAAFSQSWGITYPQATGGYDVQYIPELNTTYASGGGAIVTLNHDTVMSSVTGPSVNKFRYFFGKLYAATNGSDSFRFLDSTWNAVSNVSLNARSFYLDTIGSSVLILSESSEPYPGHVIQYNGTQAATIPGLDVYSNADHSVTYNGKKFISYALSGYESHLLIWDGQQSVAAEIPDNYGVVNLFVTNSRLYTTIILLGYYELWEYDGSSWNYVLKLPAGFNCQGAFNDNDQAVYFYGSDIYKCVLPDTNLVEIDNPITNSIYAMTKDAKTGYFYVSSNFIFWWDGKMPVSTGVTTVKPAISSAFRFDMNGKTLSVDYDGTWAIFNSLGQNLFEGKGKTTKSLSYLAEGAYVVTSKQGPSLSNKFIITR